MKKEFLQKVIPGLSLLLALVCAACSGKEIGNLHVPAFQALLGCFISQSAAGLSRPGRPPGAEDRKDADIHPEYPPSSLQTPPLVLGCTISSFAKA